MGLFECLPVTSVVVLGENAHNRAWNRRVNHRSKHANDLFWRPGWYSGCILEGSQQGSQSEK